MDAAVLLDLAKEYRGTGLPEFPKFRRIVRQPDVFQEGDVACFGHLTPSPGELHGVVQLEQFADRPPVALRDRVVHEAKQQVPQAVGATGHVAGGDQPIKVGQAGLRERYASKRGFKLVARPNALRHSPHDDPYPAPGARGINSANGLSPAGIPPILFTGLDEMKRLLLNLLTLLSLLLCVAVVTLWVRSHWVRDTIHWANTNYPYPGNPAIALPLFVESAEITSARGGLRLEWMRTETRASSGVPRQAKPVTYEASEFLRKYPLSGRPPRVRGRVTHWAMGPFEFMFAYEQDPWGQSWERWLTVPYWSLAIPLAVLPVLVPVARRHRRRADRRRNGLCVRCGYDLRATPRRCPECGAFAGG